MFRFLIITRSRKAIFYVITILIVYGILRLMDSAAAGLRDSAPEFPDPEPGETAIHETSEFIYQININSLRLRSPEIEPDKDRDRIFFVGDSFVFGLGVKEEESFTRQTEALLRKEHGDNLDVLNLGYVLQSPDTYPGRVQRVASSIEPDGLFLFVYPNDLPDLNRETLFYRMRQKVIESNDLLHFAALLFPNTVDLIVMSYMRSSLSTGSEENVTDAGSVENSDKSILQEKLDNRDFEEKKTEMYAKMRYLAYLHNIPEAEAEQWIADHADYLDSVARGEISELIILAALVRPDFHISSLDLPPHETEYWRAEQRIILKLRDIARERNIPFGVIYIPAEAQFDRQKWELNRELGYTMRSEWLTEPSPLESSPDEFLKSEEIPFLSLTETCRNAANQRLVWDFDLHFNENGHDAVTPAIADFTRSVMYPD